MSLQETAFFLQEGLTSKGKTLQEYLETENHAEAIEFLKDVVKNNRPITESLIKELHALLLKSIDYIWVGPRENRNQKRIYPGKYKTKPNHVITMDGTIHHYRSEEHTSELQSRGHLVCRLLLEKKNT